MDKNKLKKGDKIRLLQDTQNANRQIYKKGTYTFHSYHSQDRNWVYLVEAEYPVHIDSISPTGFTLEELNKELKNKENLISKYNLEIEIIKEKLEFIEKRTNVLKSLDSFDQQNNTEFDEDEFNTYYTLKMLEKEEMSLIEKAKKITDLFKNNKK